MKLKVKSDSQIILKIPHELKEKFKIKASPYGGMSLIIKRYISNFVK